MSCHSTVLACALFGVGLVCSPLAAQNDQNASGGYGGSGEATAGRQAPGPTSQQQATERIEAILRQPLTAPLDVIERPLNQVLQILAEEYDLPIQLDMAALDALAVSPEAEVSVNLRNISLESALNLILRTPALEDVTFFITQEVLLVTSKEEAAGHMEVRVYRIDDLARDAGSGELDFDRLIDVIVTSVAQDTWQENGSGEGTIAPLRPGVLVVSQTRRVHRQLTDLLEQLRSVVATIESDGPQVATSGDEQPVTVAIQTQPMGLGGDDDVRVRQILTDTIQRSVDWQRQEGFGEEEPYLAILSDRVIVRHLPSVAAQVERLIDKLGLTARRSRAF